MVVLARFLGDVVSAEIANVKIILTANGEDESREIVSHKREITYLFE